MVHHSENTISFCEMTDQLKVQKSFDLKEHFDQFTGLQRMLIPPSILMSPLSQENLPGSAVWQLRIDPENDEESEIQKFD